MKNYEAISKYIAVKYKHSGTKTAIEIKNTEKPTINMLKVPEDTASRLEIFIWENNYKESKSREETFKQKNKKTYILLPQRFTPEIYRKLKVMDTYVIIETDKDGIDITKLIWNICNLQDDEKLDAMAAVETEKQVYMFYQALYQSNSDDMEAFKEHLKWSESHNEAVWYHLILSAIAIQKNKYHQILLTWGPEDWGRYQGQRNIPDAHVTKWSRQFQVQSELKNKYIMCMDGYPQDLPGVMKLMNNYIAEIRSNRNFKKIPVK